MSVVRVSVFCFFFQAEDGIRDGHVTGVQTCALPILAPLPAWTPTCTAGRDARTVAPAPAVRPAAGGGTERHRVAGGRGRAGPPLGRWCAHGPSRGRPPSAGGGTRQLAARPVRGAGPARCRAAGGAEPAERPPAGLPVAPGRGGRAVAGGPRRGVPGRGRRARRSSGDRRRGRHLSDRAFPAVGADCRFSPETAVPPRRERRWHPPIPLPRSEERRVGNEMGG